MLENAAVKVWVAYEYHEVAPASRYAALPELATLTSYTYTENCGGSRLLPSVNRVNPLTTH